MWTRFVREVDPVQRMRTGAEWIQCVHRTAGEATRVLERKQTVKQI